MADPRDASDRSRFEQIYMEAWSSVFRFALAWTNDWSAAEDIAQDAFARLWLGRSRLDGSRRVLPWLLTTTRRVAIDRRDRRLLAD